MKTSHRYTVCSLAALLLLGTLGQRAAAQTTAAQASSDSRGPIVSSRTASFSDYLISRLRAANAEQRSYVQEVAKLVDENRLEKRLVLALERYARRKSPSFPLPVFERALRVEAGKRGVAVPMIKEIVARNGTSAARAARDSRFR